MSNRIDWNDGVLPKDGEEWDKGPPMPLQPQLPGAQTTGEYKVEEIFHIKIPSPGQVNSEMLHEFLKERCGAEYTGFNDFEDLLEEIAEILSSSGIRDEINVQLLSEGTPIPPDADKGKILEFLYSYPSNDLALRLVAGGAQYYIANRKDTKPDLKALAKKAFQEAPTLPDHPIPGK